MPQFFTKIHTYFVHAVRLTPRKVMRIVSVRAVHQVTSLADNIKYLVIFSLITRLSALLSISSSARLFSSAFLLPSYNSNIVGVSQYLAGTNSYAFIRLNSITGSELHQIKQYNFYIFNKF